MIYAITIRAFLVFSLVYLLAEIAADSYLLHNGVISSYFSILFNCPFIIVNIIDIICYDDITRTARRVWNGTTTLVIIVTTLFYIIAVKSDIEEKECNHSLCLTLVIIKMVCKLVYSVINIHFYRKQRNINYDQLINL